MEATRNIKWVGIALILLVGLIHLVDASGSMAESAAKGISFYLNAAAACVAAVGIYRASTTWGWGLGALVAAGAFVGYVVSRTVGIFGLPPDVWMEPIGVLSLVVEGLFVMVFAYAALARKALVPQASVARNPRRG